jgi:hypothetical protein
MVLEQVAVGGNWHSERHEKQSNKREIHFSPRPGWIFSNKEIPMVIILIQLQLLPKEIPLILQDFLFYFQFKY